MIAVRLPVLLALALTAASGCDRLGGGAGDPVDEEVRVDPGLGTLQVRNETDEPVAIHLDGRELYAVPPASAYMFRNLPARRVNIYGVGRVSRRHYGLPELVIEEGGDYQWTIRP